MRSILLVIPDLNYHGRSRQATLLAPALPRDRFETSVYSLRGPGPLDGPLRDASLQVLGRKSRLAVPLETAHGLRRFLGRSRPDLVHLWGLEALRMLWWATLGNHSSLPPLVVSVQAAELRRHRLRWLDRRLLGRVRAFVVAVEWEREAFIAAGVPADRVVVIPPGVPLPDPTPAALDIRTTYGIPASDFLFMMVGHFDSPNRFIDGLWGYDVIRGLDYPVSMAVVGDGPYRERIARILYYPNRSDGGVHFVGARPDAAALLQQADAVIVGHRRSGGTYAILEGMAAGRPVIATRLPHLVPLVRDEETGFLVTSASPPSSSRVALRLLKDESLRRQVGQAARDEVAKNFRVDQMASRFAEIYERALRP